MHIHSRCVLLESSKCHVSSIWVASNHWSALFQCASNLCFISIQRTLARGHRSERWKYHLNIFVVSSKYFWSCHLDTTYTLGEGGGCKYQISCSIGAYFVAFDLWSNFMLFLVNFTLKPESSLDNFYQKPMYMLLGSSFISSSGHQYYFT